MKPHVSLQVHIEMFSGRICEVSIDFRLYQSCSFQQLFVMGVLSERGPYAFDQESWSASGPLNEGILISAE